jgi:hypothetical protein
VALVRTPEGGVIGRLVWVIAGGGYRAHAVVPATSGAPNTVLVSLCGRELHTYRKAPRAGHCWRCTVKARQRENPARAHALAFVGPWAVP